MSSLFLIKVGDSVIEQGYLAHFGIPGMKWGVRKARNAEIRSRTKTQAKDKGPKRFGVLNAANSAARTYYRKERTGNFKTYRERYRYFHTPRGLFLTFTFVMRYLSSTVHSTE